ncbi:MAG: PD-(D/E)XK nuclease family protein [Anaerosomatales bacterium]|nr:PD-(D/E)XK nuclease family protein [Anaerosomatales bacterium]
MNEEAFPVGHGNASPHAIQVIDAIRSAYDRDWEKRRREFVHEFLSRTWAGIPLPVLSVCGRGTQEIRYSTYLAYFLDWSRHHGLGTRLLDKVLRSLGHNDVDTYRARVETERYIGTVFDGKESADCFCDIVVTCEQSGHVIFIEQKIHSGESPNGRVKLSQLQRYDLAIQEGSELIGLRRIKIFLTPEGKVSSKAPEWQPLSYSALISAGLAVLRDGGLSSTARGNLRRFLMDLALGPFDKAERELNELVDLAVKATMSSDFLDRLRFDEACTRNALLVELLMEG